MKKINKRKLQIGKQRGRQRRGGQFCKFGDNLGKRYGEAAEATPPLPPSPAVVVIDVYSDATGTVL